MAGFVTRSNNRSPIGMSNQNPKLIEFIKKIGTLGMDYEARVIKNSMAVGVTEVLADEGAAADENLRWALAAQDISSRKYIAFFDREYRAKREDLRRFASRNSEIQQALTIVSDTAIVYDTKNRFCYADTTGLSSILKEDAKDEIIEEISTIFNKIYTAFYFNDNQQAWWLFKQFLVDGVIAFEIIYDEKNKSIIGFKELDAAELEPAYERSDIDPSRMEKYWYLYKGNQRNERRLKDNQVIYVSNGKSGSISKVSYVENLVRSFNLLRTIENSRILWNVINASFRMKMTVPVSGASAQKWQASLGKFAGLYREDVQIDSDSGEVTMYGQPNLQFYKNYIFPLKDGQSADIQAVENGGPDLNSVEQLRYFYIRFWRDTGIPYSRFSPEGQQGNFTIGADNKVFEEIQFSNMISRMRSAFQEIILKPLWISLCINHKEFEEDPQIRANLGIRFVSDNLFKEMKEKEILEKNVTTITSLAGLKNEDGQTQYIPMDWLIKKYLGLTHEELKEIESEREKIKNQTEKDAEADAPEEDAPEAGGEKIGF